LKRLSILIFAITASTAAAGTIGFDPTLRIVDPAVSTSTTFDLRITDATAPTYIAFTAVIGSDDLSLTLWEWAPGISAICPGGVCNAPTVPGFYPSDIKIGFSVAESSVPIDEILGTLTVDVTGLAPGDYTVVIDPIRDTGFSAFSTPFDEEPISGVGRVRVVPEPATALLLGLGGLFALTRRRSKP
jgi:PEP-CTERM motif